MDIATIIREAVETLNLVPSLSDVLVIESDMGALDDELKMKIAHYSAYATVGWSGFTTIIDDEADQNGGILGSLSIVVKVYERKDVNRKAIGALTCQEIAMAIAKELHGASAEGMYAPLSLNKITPVSELSSSPDGSVVTCDVEFETKTSI